VIVMTVCAFPDDFVNHNNIRNLSGCTVVQGHLKILDSAFDGYVCHIHTFIHSFVHTKQVECYDCVNVPVCFKMH